MLHRADAVGAHTMGLQDLLVERGMASRIFVDLDDPQTADRTAPFAEYGAVASSDDVLVYQFATASTLADALAARSERLVVNYHSVTPPECFLAWDDALAHHQLWARNQLAMLADRATLGVAVSEVNRADLRACSFRATAVVPPIVAPLAAPAGLPGAAPTGLPGAPGSGPPTLRPPRPTGARWLAVGRLAPNKALEATVAALLVYRLRFDHEAELLVVGRPAVPAYAAALRQYAADLGLADAVHFTGSVGGDTLDAAYRDADVLVVSSVHEGFCLPVVEAMARGLPVVAYRQGALPEVLGPGGVLLDSTDPGVLAAAVHRLQADADQRLALADAARRQLASLDLESSGRRLADLLVAVHDGTTVPDGVRMEHAMAVPR
jgi:L-malate glycosyltransferase